MAGNKLYAEVTAGIAFNASEKDAERLYAHFTARRGITVRKSLTKTAIAGKRWMFEVTYRVHGGWKSDFAKKLETDATDTGVAIPGLEIVITRKEIPEECPRKECTACSFALRAVKAPDTMVGEIKTRRKFFSRF